MNILLFSSYQFEEVEKFFMMMVRYHHSFILSCSKEDKEDVKLDNLLYLIRNTSAVEVRESSRKNNYF